MSSSGSAPRPTGSTCACRRTGRHPASRPSSPRRPAGVVIAAALAAFHAREGSARWPSTACCASTRPGSRDRAPGPDRARRPGRPRGTARRAARRPGRLLHRRARERRAPVRPARHRQVGHRPRPAAAFADRGLRLIQVAHDELDHIDAVFEAVAGDGPWCLLYLDDLVFDDATRADRELRRGARGRRRRAAAERARVGDVEPAEHDAHDALGAGRRDRRERGARREDGAREPVRPARAVRRARRGLRTSRSRSAWSRSGSAQCPRAPQTRRCGTAGTGAGPTPRTARHFAAQYRG